MVLLEDTGQQGKAGQQNDKHRLKHLYFESQGIIYEKYPLPVGDYILGTPEVMDVVARKQKRGMAPKKIDFQGTFKTAVDTKRDMQEVAANICGPQHPRFRDECILAKNNGIKLIILIENRDGVKTLADVRNWQNPRLKIRKWAVMPDGTKKRIQAYPKAVQGEQLYKSMCTMQEEYSVEFRFCRPEEAGARVIELLTGGS